MSSFKDVVDVDDLLGFGLVLRREKLADRLLDHHQTRHVVVDGENRDDGAAAAAYVDGRGLENLPVRCACEVAQMVARLLVLTGELVEHNLRAPVPRSSCRRRVR